MSSPVARPSAAQIAAARQADVQALAAPQTPLRAVSHAAGQVEWAGPCPRCGGEDRFHCTVTWFFCRQCHAQRGDAIELLRWLQPGLPFGEAVRQLAGGQTRATSALVDNAPPPLPASKPAAARQRPLQPPEWHLQAIRLLNPAQTLLGAQAGVPGQAYLRSRGLEPQTWQHYGLGYSAHASLPGTQGKASAAAILIPWWAGARLIGIRYRFLSHQAYTDAAGHLRRAKQTAAPGSHFAGRLFGGQGLPDWVRAPLAHGAPLAAPLAERHCTLLLVEGEINAMSCWQVAHQTRLHVLSLGSESAQLTPAALHFAQRYGQVILWADQEAVAQRLMAALPGAVGVRSPGGQDANDLLQAGLLGGFLTQIRGDAAKSVGELEALLWTLYDAAKLPRGIDAGMATSLQALAGKLGKSLTLREVEPGRWRASA